MTRLIYALFLLLGVGIACIMLMPGMEGQLKKVRTVVHVADVQIYQIKKIWGFVFTVQDTRLHFTYILKNRM